MVLRGIEFGTTFGASGVMGFFGEGYPYHKLFALIPGFSFSGVTFVAKTATLRPRVGNMPLQKDGLTPRDLKPDCIKVRPFSGVALNAVGLSGPGLDFLLASGRWQARTDNFFLSFMSVGDTRKARLAELREFVEKLKKELPNFRGHIGLQLNFSCPNTGHDQRELAGEIQESLDLCVALNIALVPKLSVLIPAQIARSISLHSACDALCVSNTIPWEDMAERDQEKLFGTKISPLAHYGGGGISGNFLFPYVVDWIREARELGIEKPIIASGGIMSMDAIAKLKEAGASSVSIGSVTFLRPWRVRGIVREARKIFS